MSTVSTATASPLSCVFAPAAPLTAVLDRLPLTTIPEQNPAPRLAAPRPVSSRFADTSYPALAAYVFAAPNPSANPINSTPTAGPTRSRQRSRPTPSGSPTAGRPGWIGPTMSTPLRVEMECRGRGDGQQHHHEGTRHHR